MKGRRISDFFRRRTTQRFVEPEDCEELEPLEGSEEDTPSSEPSVSSVRSRDWRGLVEQRIQSGIERGAFDNLSGAGKPLNLDDDAFIPEDLRMAFRLLRTHSLAPLWVELNEEIRNDIRRLEHFREYAQTQQLDTNRLKYEHLRREFVSRINDINAKILNYNILAPSSQVHFPMLILEEELVKFG